MGDINLKAALGGQITLTPTNTASNYTATFPAITGVVAVQAAASYTAGSVLFANSSGQIAQNNSQFFWDNTNNYLGIGTASPSVRLHSVAGAGLAALLQNTGGVQFQLNTTAASAGFQAYTSAGITGAIDFSSTGGMIFYNGSGSAPERMRLDTSGNLGLGVTPSAWRSTDTSLQIKGTSLSDYSTGYASVLRCNAYVNSSNNEIYINASSYNASKYTQATGQHQWFTAAAGTAGNTITFTQAMTLDASGNLMIGGTTTASSAGYAFVSALGSTGGAFEVYSGTTRQAHFFCNSSLTFLKTIANISLAFGTNDTERMRIDSSGNLNIATTGVSAKLYVNGNAASSSSALTDAATIAVDMSLANNFTVTLGGNRTLGNPTNLTVGQSGVIFVTQDGTGSRTLAYSSYWKFPNGVAPVLTTTASAVDAIYYTVRTSTSITASYALNIG